jgi:hypothetical protein
MAPYINRIQNVASSMKFYVNIHNDQKITVPILLFFSKPTPLREPMEKTSDKNTNKISLITLSFVVIYCLDLSAYVNILFGSVSDIG